MEHPVFGLGELKVKESNRLKTMAKALSENGVKLKVGETSIKIFGDKNQEGGRSVATESDHTSCNVNADFGFFQKNR